MGLDGRDGVNVDSGNSVRKARLGAGFAEFRVVEWLRKSRRNTKALYIHTVFC
jgi:hypothetical protein